MFFHPEAESLGVTQLIQWQLSPAEIPQRMPLWNIETEVAQQSITSLFFYVQVLICGSKHFWFNQFQFGFD